MHQPLVLQQKHICVAGQPSSCTRAGSRNLSPRSQSLEGGPGGVGGVGGLGWVQMPDWKGVQEGHDMPAQQDLGSPHGGKTEGEVWDLTLKASLQSLEMTRCWDGGWMGETGRAKRRHNMSMFQFLFHVIIDNRAW